MKIIIDKITNKNRLVKLYGCKMCKGKGRFPLKGFSEPYVCDECNGKGYIINRDSQVLDIVERLCFYRISIKKLKGKGMRSKDSLDIANHRLAQALIKLIELHAFEGKIPGKDPISKKKIKPLYGDFLTDNEKAFRIMIQRLSENRYQVTYRLLLSFCKHHKIDIWQSVKEILEEEK